MSTVTDRIDRGLEQYYQSMGRNDYRNSEGIGLFQRFIEANGFEDEDILNELQTTHSQNMLVDINVYDEYNFPFTTEFKSDMERNKEIHVILQNIAQYGVHAYQRPLGIDLYIPQHKLHKIIEKYKKQLLCLGEQGQKEPDLMYFFAVGYVNEIPFLTYMVDAFTIDQIKSPSLTLKQWLSENKFIKELQYKDKAMKNKIMTAMSAYSYRIIPRLQFVSPYKIKDSIEEIVHFITSAACVFQSRANDSSMVVPFCIDIMFAVREVMSDFDDFTLYDDEKDDYQIGNIQQKLRSHKCAFVSQTVSNNFYKCLQSGFVENLFTKFEQKNGKILRRKRHGIFVDRRKSKNKDHKNEVTFFEQLASCGTIPNDHINEWHMDAVIQCLIPGSRRTNKQYNSNITARDGVCGQVITFSFNVEQSNEIKCYIIWNGQTMRVTGNVLAAVSSRLFVKSEYEDLSKVKSYFKIFDSIVKDTTFDMFCFQIQCGYDDMHYDNTLENHENVRSTNDTNVFQSEDDDDESTQNDMTDDEEKEDFHDKLILEEDQKEDEEDKKEYEAPKPEIFNFGVSFQYWNEKDKDHYCESKYKNLKNDLFENSISGLQISKKQWNEIYYKGQCIYDSKEMILGQNGDKNTTFARYIPGRNQYYGIQYNTKISLEHLLSILFCTDVPRLLEELEIVCSASTNEIDIQKHSEIANWLKLLAEVIIFYGNNLSNNEKGVYCCFNDNYEFDNKYRIKCNIPIKATKNKDRAQGTKSYGTVFEIVGLQSDVTWTAPFFDTRAISKFDPETDYNLKLLGQHHFLTSEYLFFKADLEIRNLSVDNININTQPWSLYQAIIEGDIITDAFDYKNGKDLYNNLFPNNSIIEGDIITDAFDYKNDKTNSLSMIKQSMCLNMHQIKNISYKPLREKLSNFEIKDDTVMQAADQKVFNINWKPTTQQLLHLVTKEKDCITSEIFKSLHGSKFFCQINTKEPNKKYGALAVVVNQLFGKLKKSSISFRFYCKQMNEFYARFDDVTIQLNGNEADATQIVYFEWEELKRVVRKGKGFEWDIVILNNNEKSKSTNLPTIQTDQDDQMIQDLIEKLNIDFGNAAPNKLDLPHDLPLHRFTPSNVCDVVKWWLYNDIKFKYDLKQTIQIFIDCTLSGNQILSLSIQNIRRILEKELLKFMTRDTVDIILKQIIYWKTVDDKSIKTKLAQEIGYLLYHHPADMLFKRIFNEFDIVSGDKFIEYYRQKKHWIQYVTGWKQTEIYQLQSLLFRHKSLTLSEITEIMDNVLPQHLGQECALIIKTSICKRFDVEEIFYKIKNAIPNVDFGDFINEMIDDLVEKQSQTDEINDQLVKNVYKAVADCFVLNYDSLKPTSEYDLDLHQGWTCFICSNYNFCNFVSSKINVELSICSLCGTTQRDSIIIKLKNYDTLIDTKIDNTQNQDSSHKDKAKLPVQTDDTHIEIEQLVQDVSSKFKFNIYCLDRNDNKHCPFILRLAKYLIIYKRWVNEANGTFEKTTQVNIHKHVTNDTFKVVFINAAESNTRLSEQENNKLLKLLNDNIINKDIFITMVRKKFCNTFAKQTKIKVGVISKLHKQIDNKLKEIAHENQFGRCISDIDFEIIQKDYHHIIASHITDGTKDTMENVFKFFDKVVHYEDLPSQIEKCMDDEVTKSKTNENVQLECKSVIRMTESNDKLLHNEEKTNDNNVYSVQNRNVWQSKQRFIQRQLDMMHHYLVHSDWKDFFSRYVHEQKENENIKINDSSRSTQRNNENKQKFITDFAMNNYGFGIDHLHPHMNGKYFSIRDELLFNTLCSLSISQFRLSFTKAINKHGIALRQYGNTLICKYYHKEYNIIRNEPISIKHILALVIYTDMSEFCTIFRQT
eukprot:100835_1